MFVQEFLLMVFRDPTFSIGMKYNTKPLEWSILFHSSSSVPTHYLNNWNLSEKKCFYLFIWKNFARSRNTISQPGNMFISALVNSRGIVLKLAGKSCVSSKWHICCPKIRLEGITRVVQQSILEKLIPPIFSAYPACWWTTIQSTWDVVNRREIGVLVRVLMTSWRQYQTWDQTKVIFYKPSHFCYKTDLIWKNMNKRELYTSQSS